MDPWRSISSLSPQEIRSLQNKKLNTFINTQIYPFSPHYRRIFDQNKINPKSIRSVEDLKHLPLTSKSDFINKENPQIYKEFVLRPDEKLIRQYWPASKLARLALKNVLKGKESVLDGFSREYRPVFMTFTTGTTNSPVPFLYSNYDIENLNVSGARMLSLFNMDPDGRIMNIFPFAPHLAFWQVFFGGLASNVFALSTGGGKVMGTDGNLAAVLKVQPSLILGVPSYIYHLVRTAQEKNLNLSFINKVVLGAAKVTVPFKERMASLLQSMGSRDVSIFGTYGFTESRAAWAECPSALNVSSGYHLYPDKEIFEVIDPKTGEVKGEGEDGELVYTSLDARASVVLRYRTGDFVKGGIVYAPCPCCKRLVPRISNDIVRLSDTKDLQLSKVKGSLVDFNHFASIFAEFDGVEEWQVEIRKHNNDPFDVDELCVYISVRSGVNVVVLEEEIKKRFLTATEVSPNSVTCLSMNEMVKRLELETANKEKRIIDVRPK
jgi:phenylacetate-coenzyme A ligase PaaK-like adenylate-forming protein